MRLLVRKFIGGIALVAALLVPSLVDAGTLQLRIEDLTSGMGVVIDDNGSGDLVGLDGTVSWAGALDFAPFTFDVTTGTSKPVIGGDSLAHLDLHSLTFSVGGPARVRVTLQDSDFQLPYEGLTSIIGQIGGTLTAPSGSTISAQSWVSPSNGTIDLGSSTGGAVGPLPGIGGIPADAIRAFSTTYATGPGAFSATDYSNFLLSGPFSLFTQVTIDFTGSGVVSFNQDAMVPVPEPGSLLLLGSGLVGLARAARRRRSPATN